MTPATCTRRWGFAHAWLHRLTHLHAIDLLLVLGIVGATGGVLQLMSEWTQPMRPSLEIDLDDPWNLPLFTFYSMTRGLIAYVFSLLFTLVYGYWAAKDRTAERFLIPLLDILQSIPVLSFLPGIVLALVAAFPSTNIGLELAAILMIFTGQAWNMTFSFYHSLRSVPADLQEVAQVYRFNWLERFRWVELPFAAIGLIWNSMMSMAGGWFFLMINEAFRLGEHDYRLPGIGAYMSVAVEQERYGAMVAAIVAMTIMIVTLDQLLWRPVVVWAQKFRMEEGGDHATATSWVLHWLQGSRLIRFLGVLVHKRSTKPTSKPANDSAPVGDGARSAAWGRWLSLGMFALLALGLLLGGWKLLGLLGDVTGKEWLRTLAAAGLTLGRVLLATAIGTLWAVPAGLFIGLSPRWSRWLQPVVQIAASFPAPMLFPLVVVVLTALGVELNWGSIVLMLLGTQWYILFNVVAGAMAIPTDLREAARSFRIGGWQLFRTLYLPAIFPYLVTGWVTAAGGAWNASIVSEYVVFRGTTLQAWGLGAQISTATEQGKFGLLAASTVVMAVVVVVFNRTVWRACYQYAESRFSIRG